MGSERLPVKIRATARALVEARDTQIEKRLIEAADRIDALEEQVNNLRYSDFQMIWFSLFDDDPPVHDHRDADTLRGVQAIIERAQQLATIAIYGHTPEELVEFSSRRRPNDPRNGRTSR